MKEADAVPEKLTVKEVAALKGVGEDAVYKAVREKRLPSERIFGRIVVPVEALGSYDPQHGGSRGGGRPAGTRP